MRYLSTNIANLFFSISFRPVLYLVDINKSLGLMLLPVIVILSGMWKKLPPFLTHYDIVQGCKAIISVQS